MERTYALYSCISCTTVTTPYKGVGVRYQFIFFLFPICTNEFNFVQLSYTIIYLSQDR
jgi:hypothetical protein